jgi:hypothetical protein
MVLAAAETTAAATKAAAAGTTAEATATSTACAAGTTAAASTATRAALAAGTTGTANHNWLAGQKAFTLQFLARKLAGAAHGLGLFAGSLFRWLFEMIPELHLTEHTLALHLFLEGFKRLIDVVVANENLQAVVSSQKSWDKNAQKHQLRRLYCRSPRLSLVCL